MELPICIKCNTLLNNDGETIQYINGNNKKLPAKRCNCTASYYTAAADFWSLKLARKFGIECQLTYVNFRIFKYGNIKVLTNKYDLEKFRSFWSFNSVEELENLLEKYYKLEVFS